MITSSIFLIFIAASFAALSMLALREHREALRLRAGLFDNVAGIVRNPHIAVARDHFPVLTGQVADGRDIKLELIADTLVFRRLPQLWLKVTLREDTVLPRPSIGALARPTGAEFYSIVHDLPEWLTPPVTGAPLLMRGDIDIRARDVERASGLFRSLFADATVKEAAITPRGVRLVRQVSQGDRGAHLLLRQIRFPLEAVPAELVRTAVAEVEALSQVLGEDVCVPEKLSA